MNRIYKQFGVYRITNVENGKSYIGQTKVSFGDRWDNHKALLRSGKHDNKNLQSEWDEFGEGSFEFVIVEAVDSFDDLDALEMKYISEYKKIGLSYNIHDGGSVGFNKGMHLSDETKRKIGEKNRINMTGRKASESTKRKMSESQLARYSNWSNEDRKAHGERSYSSGYKWDDDAKRRFSELQQISPNGAKYTADDIRNIRSKHENGATFSELANEYGTTSAYISSIIKRRRWANID